MERAASLSPGVKWGGDELGADRINSDIGACDSGADTRPEQGGTMAHAAWQPRRDELLQRQILTPARR